MSQREGVRNQSRLTPREVPAQTRAQASSPPDRELSDQKPLDQKPDQKLASLSRCEAALARVSELAQNLAQDTRETRGTLPSGRARQKEDMTRRAYVQALDAKAREQLSRALGDLEPELALKLRTLMIAGRDAQSIARVSVNVSLSDSDAGFAAMAADSSDNGPLLVDYLRRGHAIACATGVKLDAPLVDWQSQAPRDLDERAWASFGKQLANSSPREWTCFGVNDPGTRQLGKLYLKLGDRAWWSFAAVLDRPTRGGMEKERRSFAKGRAKGISASTMEAVAGQLGGAQGRALRRAVRAICARLGHVARAAAR